MNTHHHYPLSLLLGTTQVTDKLFIGRIVILALVGLFAVVGVVLTVIQSAEPILAAPLRRVKL